MAYRGREKKTADTKLSNALRGVQFPAAPKNRIMTYTNTPDCECAIYESWEGVEKLICSKHSESGNLERIK